MINDPPYQIREEATWAPDCALIHPEAQEFDRLFEAIQFALERAPYLNAAPLDNEGKLWVRRFRAHTTADGARMPAVRVSYEVVRNPPDGLIALHHVRTPEDILAGIHDPPAAPF